MYNDGIGVLWEFLSRTGNTINRQAEFLYKVYIYGFVIAIILMSWGLKWIGRLVTAMLGSYIFVMTIKNLYSYIQFRHELYQNFTYYRDLERGGLSYWPIY